MAPSGEDSESAKAIERLLIEAHETERETIARELHDDISQRIAVATIDLDTLIHALPLPESGTRARLQALSDALLQLAKDIQDLSHRLYPSKLQYLGLVSAASSFCQEASKKRDADIVFTHDGIPDTVPSGVALIVFRVLEEAVNNAVKHAGVRRVDASLRARAGQIRLEVVDGGVGFDVGAALGGRARGLVGMRERTRLAGGELSITSRPGAGTTIAARIPIAGVDSLPR